MKIASVLKSALSFQLERDTLRFNIET